MKKYLVENNQCNIKLNGVVYPASSQFEVDEVIYESIKDIVELITVFEEEKKEKEKKPAKKVD